MSHSSHLQSSKQHHASAHSPQHHPGEHKKHHKIPAHKHALRIGSLLGILFIIVLSFASAQTSFFSLFEKKVNDKTLSGFVPQGFPCTVDVTGGCIPQEIQNPEEEPATEEPCAEIDVTGGCVLPNEPEDIPEENPLPQEVPARTPSPEPEPSPMPEPEPEIQELIPIPEPQPEAISPAPEAIPAPEPQGIAPSEPAPEPEDKALISPPIENFPVQQAAEPKKENSPEPVLLFQAAPSPKPTLPKLDLNAPEDSCLYFDPNYPVVMNDINPENKPIAELPTLEDKAIVLLSKSYVKNGDGSRTYIIEGRPMKGSDPNIREFVPQANIIRRDAAKLEILIHCLDIKSVDYLKRVGQTVSGKRMPRFDDLPLSDIRSFNDAIIYSAAFYDIMNGTLYGPKIQADAQRDILVGEAIKTLVRTRQMILGNVLTQDSPTGAWYNAFFDSALDEGLGVEDLREMGNEPITRGRFAQELLELALLRHMYSNQQEVEGLLYDRR